MTAGDNAQERYTVEVFGLRLEVSNPALAELLMMDARRALTTDIRELPNPRRFRELQAEAAEALPGVMLAPHTLRDDVEEAARRRLHARAGELGRVLGFATATDGLWRSRHGVLVVTRVIDRPISPAAATHFVGEIAPRVTRIAGKDASVLFVTARREAADALTVGIRHECAQRVMRVVCLADLETLASMATDGVVDHRAALGLLSPAAGIDAGETIALLAQAREAFAAVCRASDTTVA